MPSEKQAAAIQCVLGSRRQFAANRWSPPAQIAGPAKFAAA
jgi:hypothetical protein